MKTTYSLLRATAIFAGVFAGAVSPAHAQTPAADTRDLAQYDRNQNGRLDPDERAARDAAEAKSVPVETTPGAAETVVLSPFEVTDSSRGYYASNTMSGTRLNSKIEDLAASVTVITKEQMADFAMLDINDIFLYEAGTEGTGTYTEFSVDRNGSPTDNSLNPNSANRVRGIGSANISLGNFETSGRVPLDPIGFDSVEISRGPNSTVFGLGGTAGTVNMQPSSAQLQRNRSQLVFRADSFDGYRSSLDLNRVLKRGVLAVRGSAVYQHDGFVRKPSGTDTTRLNGMVRYQPFKYTSITASYSYYAIEGKRPNTTMPRDAVTSWKNAGSPTWDPVTQFAKINGVSVGKFAQNATPSYFSNSAFRGYSTLFIDGDGSVGFWSASRAASGTTPLAPDQHTSLQNTTPEPIRATQPLFSTDRSVTGKELYDWSTINLAAMNHLRERTATTLLQMEQIFLNTPRHLLALQAGYYREDSRQHMRGVLGTPGSSGPTGYLHVDANERMLDGSPNPFFLRPFIGVYDVKATYDAPSSRENIRLQLAYRLDLRREKSLLRWLGLQQCSAYGEYRDAVSGRILYRDVLSPSPTGPTWNPGPTTGRFSSFTIPNITTNYFRYYVGDTTGQNVDYAPRDFALGQYNYVWGNGVTGRFVTEPARLGRDYLYGSISNARSVLKTRGGVIQSYLLQDRVVTTLGLRDDRSYNRNGATPEFLSQPDGIHLDEDAYNRWAAADWTQNSGRTTSAGIVVKPLRWLFLHANSSNSFRPSSYAVDLFLRPVPNPTGKGRDGGFSLSLFEGRLVARVNRYETSQINARNSSSAIIAQRVRAIDFDAPYSTPELGLAVRAQGWITAQAAAQGITLTTDQLNARISSLTGLEPAFFTSPLSRTEQSGQITETGDVVAKGTEIELNFNPSRFWMGKLNITQQESIDTRLSPGVTNWIALRTPIWEKIIDPETGRPWFTERYGNRNSAAQFLAADVQAPLNVAIANLGKSRPQIRQYRANLSTSYRLAGLSDHRLLKRFTVGGALRWEDKGAIGYYGVEQLPAVITTLDRNRPVWDQARWYVDAFFSYRTRLFADKVGASFQLNVRNLNEGGRLQPVSAYPDGTPNAYRIVDPRQFILTATFEL
jgi:outer membrane receptor protein involved in Fe transport